MNGRVATTIGRTAWIAGFLLATAGFLATPSTVRAEEGDRRCVCDNTTTCAPYQWMRFCCDFDSGGSYNCGCTLMVVNCILDE